MHIFQLATCEKDLNETKHQLALLKINHEAMEILMQKQSVDCAAQITSAKEEIAVKVAQVKQYQKQVEAYKQQVLQLSAFACVQNACK